MQKSTDIKNSRTKSKAVDHRENIYCKPIDTDWMEKIKLK